MEACFWSVKRYKNTSIAAVAYKLVTDETQLTSILTVSKINVISKSEEHVMSNSTN